MTAPAPHGPGFVRHESHGPPISKACTPMLRPLVKSAQQDNNFLISQYVVGTQKNRLNETVLLSTQNI